MFTLLTDECWESNNPSFPLEEFFYLVVELFEQFPNSSWTIGTLAWYNQKPPSQIPTIFYGPLVNPRLISSYQALPNCLLAIGPSGDIEWIEEDIHRTALQAARARHGSLDVPLLILQYGKFILPGFVDTHTYELLDWLTEVTFPMETRFADVDFARRALRVDHNHCCYYGTLHLEATKILADIINAHEPILTPRFAISCTGPLLSQLGTMARADPTLPIQTHISETRTRYGLLCHHTILAHAIHLEEQEIALIKKRDAGVNHCPTSNFNLRSGVCAVGNLIDRRIKVGLGTDVSGGLSRSILTAIQHASIASKISAVQSPAASESSPGPSRQFSLATLLHLATSAAR
ncbi:hypothetical protein BGW80DRAFT_1440798 [Lactifluus volemus]|nr:hypothetical protein BGW80DRAFT_1440798 [Lactifluus volemus]